MAKKPDVRQTGNTYWFSLPKAASLSGLTKNDLMRRAESGELKTDPSLPSEYWFDREEIWALKMAKEERSIAWRDRNKDRPIPPDKLKGRQEREWEKISEEWASGWIGGGVSRHTVRVMQGESNNKRD